MKSRCRYRERERKRELEVERSVPYPEFARCVSAARPNGGKTAKSRALRGLVGGFRTSVCLL